MLTQVAGSGTTQVSLTLAHLLMGATTCTGDLSTLEGFLNTRLASVWTKALASFIAPKPDTLASSIHFDFKRHF